MDALFETKKQKVESFFATEVSQIEKKFSEQASASKEQLENEVGRRKELLASIFPKNEQITKLLILADLINSSELRNSCLGIIRENFDECRNSPDFGSKFLKQDTIKQILSRFFFIIFVFFHKFLTIF